ncbi:type II toxin-antitoxin system VapB family antitoxin [Nonomuraea sp. NPDC049480]|uniref:type II toxin-antitoxin system VapB family antitoxin n=1 Tax=Nonomuraea sp. NPDC049480 TaxID=3364353 RepID=UPI0037AF7F2B
MRTVIDIDEDLFDEAAEELGTKGRKATVNAALEHFARRRRQREAVAAILSMDLDYSAEPWQTDHKNHPGECA